MPNIDNSPWYKIMEKKGHAWNNYAQEIGGKIDGHFNADFLTFNMVKNIYGIEVEILGIRNLTSVATNFVPYNGAIVEELIIKFKKDNLNTSNFYSIKHNNLKNQLLALFSSYKKVKRVEKFLIHYNTDACYNELMNKNILSYNALNKVKLNKKGFILQMFYLPQEIKSQNTIINFCEWAVLLH